MSKIELPAPNWRPKDIVAAAGRLANEFELKVGRNYIEHHGQRFEDVYRELLKPRFGIILNEGEDLGEDEGGKKVLGTYNYFENSAKLDASLSVERKDPRRVFTLYHEVAGHGALQGKWLRSHLTKLDPLQVTDISIGRDAETTLERQANLFAAHLAAPDWLVDFAMHKIFCRKSRFVFLGPCEYCLTTAGGLSLRNYVTDARGLSAWMGTKIDQYFGGLSGEALGYRILERGWIDDRTGGLASRIRSRAGRLFRTSKR